MQTRFSGNIEAVRAIEDCIRATKKYTKGAFSKPLQHPVQGEDFPNRLLTEYYEVYPKMEISWNMPVNQLQDWLWCDTPCISVVFCYDYRSNNAYVTIKNGNGSVHELMDNIPGIRDALKQTVEKNGKH